MLAVDGSPEGIARLRESVPPSDRDRLTTRVAPHSELDLPPADLVYAGLSLRFCNPREFDEVWRQITSARAGTRDMTFHTRAEVEALLADFEIEGLREQDEGGEAVSDLKHWHVLHVIARKQS